MALRKVSSDSLEGFVRTQWTRARLFKKFSEFTVKRERILAAMNSLSCDMGGFNWLTGQVKDRRRYSLKGRQVTARLSKSRAFFGSCR